VERPEGRDQESVVGRTKLDNVEIKDKPSNSHVALNTIEDPDGNELKILRDNMPFGSVKDGEFGTYYIAYAATPDVPSRCCAGCSSATRTATTTASSTSRRPSPGRCSSCRRPAPRRPARPRRMIKVGSMSGQSLITVA